MCSGAMRHACREWWASVQPKFIKSDASIHSCHTVLHRDGYLKYYNLGQKNPGLIEKRRAVYADRWGWSRCGRHVSDEAPCCFSAVTVSNR